MTAGRVVIVGAGLTGPLLGMLLARHGYEVDIIEGRPDLRLGGERTLRSVNLTLSERGLRALREVGLEQEVITKLGQPLRARAVHLASGAVNLLPYGHTGEQVLYAVSRAGLSSLLVDAAEKSHGVRFHFGVKCLEVDRTAPSVVGVETATGRRRHFTGDLVVGADGTHSMVRRYVQHGAFADLQMHYVPWRYKEIVIKGELDPTVLHAWPRGDRMMFALPNVDGTFNGVCVLPAGEADGFDALDTPDRIRRCFDETFGDVSRLIPDLEEQVRRSPVSAFPTMLTSQWYHGDTVVLVGDACHSVVPFFGQGMNAGFEDCLELSRCVAETPDRATAFATYQRRREPQSAILAKLSLDNFAEMRESGPQHRVAARKYLLHWLYRRSGGRIVPIYTMIAHSAVPYMDCVARAERQDRLLRRCGADIAVSLITMAAMVRRVWQRAWQGGRAERTAARASRWSRVPL
ncbi:NAD(P)/FAD-dependent oxidoreductase [Micromonospora arborensis]|uniref:FAD-dependent oxidoreductase n=1 Tax=Micromonospora arborensis TaxID=2116518 RepID=UPI0033C60A01